MWAHDLGVNGGSLKSRLGISTHSLTYQEQKKDRRLKYIFILHWDFATNWHGRRARHTTDPTTLGALVGIVSSVGEAPKHWCFGYAAANLVYIFEAKDIRVLQRFHGRNFPP